MDQQTLDYLNNLQKRITKLESKRIMQMDILPGSVKQRHINEGVIFIRSGLDAKLPTKGETTVTGQPFYWATDTGKLYAWNGTAWKSATFS